MEKKLIIISGPSQSGKNTLANLLQKKHKNVERVITSTSRKPKPKEPKNNYHFIKKEDFKHKENFLEMVNYAGAYYGVQKKDLNSVLNKNKIAVIIVDVNGLVNIMKKREKVPNKIISIFLAPRPKDLLERLIRKNDPNIIKRIKAIKKEIKLSEKYQFILDTSKTKKENLKELESIVFEKNKKLLEKLRIRPKFLKEYKKLKPQSIYRF